jgi:dihydroorotase
MADAGVLLLLHGEVTDGHVDMFDREAVFIQTKLVRRPFARLCFLP